MDKTPDRIGSSSPQTTEETLVGFRRQKAEHIRARGANPFANDVDTTDRTLLQELRARCQSALVPDSADRYDASAVTELIGSEVFCVVGRITAKRGFGKACFLTLRDVSGELQLFLKKDVLGDAFELLDEIEVADHIEARGRLLVTKTGELSLEPATLRLLTKALRPLPEKWHGLTDIEQRYRRRYLDLLANPEVGGVLAARSAITQGLRSFLDGQGFLEVETPTLHTLVGGAAARPFKTHHHALDMELFLRIAPELYLKRLMVGGLERIYEIGRCYRNEGISTRHNPEFTMLEFYQAYATCETLMPTAEGLFRYVDEFLKRKFTRLGLGRVYDRWHEARPFTLAEPFVRLPMRAAIERSFGPSGLGEEILSKLALLGGHTAPDQVDDGSTQTAADQLIPSWCQASERARAVDWANLRRALKFCSNEGERVFVAYEYLAEPFLAKDYRSADGTKSVPVFILDHPAEVSPLARRKDSDPTLTDRFELFVDGQELCNAFSELNDPDDQAERFREQVAKRARGAEETMDYDADYIRALEHGMPPAAGFGLGVDRLVMALTVQPSIRDVIAFPLLRVEGR